MAHSSQPAPPRVHPSPRFSPSCLARSGRIAIAAAAGGIAVADRMARQPDRRSGLMHEMALAESMLQLVEETARREQARCVKLVVVEIGRLASVEPDALRFCFAAVTAGSLADGARLEIIELPGQGWCAECNATVALAEVYGCCPHCGSGPLQPTGGREMRVREIGIE